MKDHKHTWETSGKPNMLICTAKDCNTMSDLTTVLKNTKALASLEAKVSLLANQLRRGDLLKKAVNDAYAFVKHNGDGILVENQELQI